MLKSDNQINDDLIPTNGELEGEGEEEEVKMSRETQKLMLEYFKRVSAPRILEERRKERE